jgi:hypothetical protein
VDLDAERKGTASPDEPAREDKAARPAARN